MAPPAHQRAPLGPVMAETPMANMTMGRMVVNCIIAVVVCLDDLVEVKEEDEGSVLG